MMAQIQRAYLAHLYRRAQHAEQLPWHSEKPPELLCRAVEADPSPGRALDIGCGSGVFSLWLAERGYQVTAMDFLEPATRMAAERVRGVTPPVEVVCASVLEFQPREQFDLVLDRGCLHTLQPSDRPRYRDQLLRWLKPGGSYVLVHLGRRHALDWRPVGPRRRSREEVLGLFGPSLQEVEHRSVIQALPLPIGPTVQLNSYWLRRAASN
jgi:2-polyprenyl-3-methyl-5-hydroxy-6-metoxy-1,4-benzoquinol methylase